jgi:uncharacterized membrane protein
VENLDGSKDLRVRWERWIQFWEGLGLLLIGLPLLLGVKGLLSDPFWPGLVWGLVFIIFYLLSPSERKKRFGEASYLLRGVWKFGRLSNRPQAIWVATAGMALLYGFVSQSRHQQLESHAFDLGIFTNTMYNFVFGHGYFSAVKGGIQLFSDHQSPSFWLFSPAFWMFPSPLTLLWQQAILISLSGWLTWKWSLRILSEEGRGTLTQEQAKILAWFFAWAAWLSPAFRNANAFDFHPEVILLPAFLFGVFHWDSPRRGLRVLAWLSLLVALGGKESSGPVAAGVGLALSWALPRVRLQGMVLSGLGVLVFLFDLKVVPGWVNASTGSTTQESAYAYAGLYSQYGEGLLSLFLAPILKPLIFWPQILNFARVKFLFFTLAPLAFLPLLHRAAWLALLPAYGMLFLSQGDHRVNIQYHYGMEPSVGLLLFLPFGVLRLLRMSKETGKWMSRGMEQGILTGILCALVFFGLIAHQKSEVHRVRQWTLDPHLEFVQAQILAAIPKQRTLLASDALVPHLSLRPWVHPLGLGPTVLKVTWRDQPQSAHTWVDCVLIEKTASNWPLDSAEVEEVERRAVAAGYQHHYRCGSLSLYASPQLSRASGENCLDLSRLPSCPSQ